MKKKSIISIFVLFVLFVGFAIPYNILVSNNCKNHSISKIIDSISDLGFEHAKECVSKSNIVTNIKLLLKNNEFLYQVARKYRRTYQMPFFKYDNAFEIEDIEYVDKKIIEEKNLKKPFIKGLIEGLDGIDWSQPQDLVNIIETKVAEVSAATGVVESDIKAYFEE